MKYFVLIILFFAAMSFAQVGKYSHIVAGGFNRAGQRLANGFACWDQKASRFGNLPRASFGGGRVSDIATAGKGFLAVGDFTSVNGMQANGIAFFDGSKWCAFPHLNLYYYVKPFPAPTTIQYPYNRNAVAGSATGISAIGNDYYVFGGQVAGRTRFNQIGAVQTNVAGLVKLTFDGTGNFTVGQIAGYETQGGRGTGNPEPNNPGFPADSAPSGVIGTTKVRAAILNSVLNVYVHPSVGVTIPDNQANVWRWRQGDTQWLQVTQTAIAAFNVSSTVQTFNVLADRLTNVITDFDHDGTNLIVVGKFDNSANTTANVNYVNVATSNSASGQSITWTAGVNWPNVNNYNQTASTALRIAVESTGVFYVASTFTSVDATTTGDLNLLGVAQFFVYKVTSGSPVALGAASPRFDLPGQNPSFARLQVYNGRLYVFGNFAYYTWFNNQNNRWPRHYTRCISNAVYYDGTDFVDAYGGFTQIGNAYPLVAPNAQGADFLYVDGATNFYDLFSAGSVVAYNTDTKRWVNLASQRFSTRGSNGAASTQQGVDGTVAAVHFIRSQRSGINDAVVVAGQFDWYGNQYLASTAFLRTSTGTYEQLGGGLFVEENDSTYEADQTLPLYRAGLVADIEEIDNRFYAAGTFTKNTQGACLNNVASVSATNTGDVWTALGAGCDNAVVDLIAKGNDLYVAGAFTSCGGVDGTRRVARYDTKKGTWWALQAGLPDGVVYAMIWYRGNLLVGGQFTNTPAAYRSSLSTTANRNTGLWEWDGNRWAPLSGRCLKDCDGNTAFTFPFGNRFDPASRSVSNVRSLRTTGGNLYIHATVGGAAPSNVLVQFDGNTFKQYGTASGNCAKQGCIASNFSEVIVAGFTRPGENYNNNYLQYNPDRQNWVDTFTGFDNAPVIVASASNIALSLFSLFLIVLLAF